MADEWGNSPFDRLRRELLDRIDKSDQATARQVGDLRVEMKIEVKEIKDTKAAKWVETAMSATIGLVCAAVLTAGLALVVITKSPRSQTNAFVSELYP